jgi:hypothetical protein
VLAHDRRLQATALAHLEVDEAAAVVALGLEDDLTAAAVDHVGVLDDVADVEARGVTAGLALGQGDGGDGGGLVATGQRVGDVGGALLVGEALQAGHVAGVAVAAADGLAGAAVAADAVAGALDAAVVQFDDLLRHDIFPLR